MGHFMVFSVVCLTVIMLSAVLARPEPHFGRHRHHHNDEESSNDPFPFGHDHFRQHPHGGHHHGFAVPCHHGHGFEPDQSHGFGFGHTPHHPHHHHHHPIGGYESNSYYDKFPFNYDFNLDRDNLPFGFPNDFDGFVAPNFQNAPNGVFPFPGSQLPNPFVPLPNNFPNMFNPMANWPPMTNGVNMNIPPNQPPFNEFDFSAFTTTTLPALDPASVIGNDDDNNNNNHGNETTLNNTINSNTNTNDGNGDAVDTVGWLNANEFLHHIPCEANSNNDFNQLGGEDGDAVVNSENPIFIATTTSAPIPSVTSNVDEAVTATTSHHQTNTDYLGLIDVRFGDDAKNNETTTE